MPTNPFPLEAVATYGTSLPTSVALAYMRAPEKELVDYVTAYPDPELRYGGAIGLAGGHGSGKTHLLTSLPPKFGPLQSIQVRFLYAKADSANMFDLYKQLVSQLDRPTLVSLIDLAMKNIAVETVRASRATESIEGRIQPGRLEMLYDESNLDREQLTNVLEERLLETHVPAAIPQVMLSIGSSEAGEAAYHWLTGDEVQDLPKLNLAHSLRQLGDETGGSSAADVRAVDALETLAALHRLAGVPLVLLIDQLEVLLRTDAQRQQTLFSVFKKLVEQASRQLALVFVAGAEDAWRQLPRDVAPRLRVREPLPVGGLNLAETGLLLSAYAKADRPFAQDALETIHELSGGSPREILRIAHHAFEKTKGNTASADDGTLLASAQDAGTVADRSVLALSMADAVLLKYGSDIVRSNLMLDGLTLDRVVSEGGMPFGALLVARATDKLSEVDLARTVTSARGALDKEWPGCELLVVTVGYSSDEVRELLGTTIVFDERTFTNLLETEMTRIAARRPQTVVVGGDLTGREINIMQAPAENPELVKLLERVSKRLDELETQRTTEAAEVQERFSETTHALAAPELQQEALRTRSALLEALDRVEDALYRQAYLEERDRMRAVLVASETSAGDPMLYQLAVVYLDALAVGSAARTETGNRHADDTRHELIRDIRGVLRQHGLFEELPRSPVLMSVLAGGVLALATLLVYLTTAVPVYALGAIGVLLFAFGFALTYQYLRARNPVTTWQFRVRELRRFLEIENERSMLRS
jgi:hypothetical protein